MKNFYSYCTLAYKHSPFLDESINVGVLIYFSQSKRFSFTYSKNLSRIKSIYDNVAERTIKEFLRRLNSVIDYTDVTKEEQNGLFSNSDIFNLQNYVSNNFLALDSSVLKFINYKTQSYSDINEKIIERALINNLFIDDIRPITNFPKEPQLLNNLIEKLKYYGLEKFRHKTGRFREDVTITNEVGNIFNFEYAWKNGSLNLIKPISFDLKKPESIIGKAHKNLGEFFDLEKEAEAKNYKYHLLVGKPSSKVLHKDYDTALKILNKIDHAEIIPEEEIPSYSKQIIKEIQKPLV